MPETSEVGETTITILISTNKQPESTTQLWNQAKLDKLAALYQHLIVKGNLNLINLDSLKYECVDTTKVKMHDRYKNLCHDCELQTKTIYNFFSLSYIWPKLLNCQVMLTSFRWRCAEGS